MPVRSFAAPDAAQAHFSLAPLAALCRQVLGAGVLLTAAGGAAAQASDAAAELPKITVKANRDGGLAPAHPGGQVARGGSLGLLGVQDTLDTPFSTTNFTAQALENQQARTIADVLVSDASVRMTSGSGGFDDTFQIRGFAVNATDVGFNGLFGLVSQNRVPAQLVERVELLKGPGALLNGIAPGGSIGGGINIVSKRAGDVPLTRLTTTYQSSSHVSLAADVGQRFGEDNAWGVRFNGLVGDGEASIDDGNVRNLLGALAVDYDGGRLRGTVDVILQKDDTDNFRPQISLDSVGTIPAPPDARSNWYPGTTLVQRDSTVAGRLELDVTDRLTAYAGLGYRDGTNDQVFPRSATPVNSAGAFKVQNTYYDSYTQTTSGNVGFNWRLKTGAVGHTVMAVATAMSQEAGNAYIPWDPVADSNIYDPSPLPTNPRTRTEPLKGTESRLISYAVADTLAFSGERLLVTLGARRQTVRTHGYNGAGVETTSYDASTITPLAAVLFKATDKVSVYGNYTAGLSNGQRVSEVASPAYANAGAVLAPYKSKQVEAGVKADWGTVTTTAAVFQIARPSAIRNAQNALAYEGELRTRGVELSAYGEVQRGLRGMAGVTVLDPTLRRTATGANEGNDAAGVPNLTASAGADWDLPWEPALTFSGRVLYTSGAYLNDANTQRFDAWTRLDLGARYQLKVAGAPVVLRAQVENVFDKNYWLTTGTYVGVGAPRTFVLSASVDL